MYITGTDGIGASTGFQIVYDDTYPLPNFAPGSLHMTNQEWNYNNAKFKIEEISIINSVLNMGNKVIFIAEKFYCKDSTIQANDITLPPHENLQIENCNFIGELHYLDPWL